MATTNIEKRRKLRALEAKRDKLLEAQANAKKGLAMVRAELKQAKR